MSDILANPSSNCVILVGPSTAGKSTVLAKLRKEYQGMIDAVDNRKLVMKIMDLLKLPLA